MGNHCCSTETASVGDEAPSFLTWSSTTARPFAHSPHQLGDHVHESASTTQETSMQLPPSSQPEAPPVMQWPALEGTSPRRRTQNPLVGHTDGAPSDTDRRRVKLLAERLTLVDEVEPQQTTTMSVDGGAITPVRGTRRSTILSPTAASALPYQQHSNDGEGMNTTNAVKDDMAEFPKQNCGMHCSFLNLSGGPPAQPDVVFGTLEDHSASATISEKPSLRDHRFASSSSVSDGIRQEGPYQRLSRAHHGSPSQSHEQMLASGLSLAQANTSLASEDVFDPSMCVPSLSSGGSLLPTSVMSWQYPFRGSGSKPQSSLEQECRRVMAAVATSGCPADTGTVLERHGSRRLGGRSEGSARATSSSSIVIVNATRRGGDGGSFVSSTITTETVDEENPLEDTVEEERVSDVALALRSAEGKPVDDSFVAKATAASCVTRRALSESSSRSCDETSPTSETSQNFEGVLVAAAHSGGRRPRRERFRYASLAERCGTNGYQECSPAEVGEDVLEDAADVHQSVIGSLTKDPSLYDCASDGTASMSAATASVLGSHFVTPVKMRPLSSNGMGTDNPKDRRDVGRLLLSESTRFQEFQALEVQCQRVLELVTK